MAAMSNEGDGLIYDIAEVGSCIGEAKICDLKCVFLFVPPSQKKGAPRRWNARVYSTYFYNLATNTSNYPKLPHCFKISLVL